MILEPDSPDAPLEALRVQKGRGVRPRQAAPGGHDTVVVMQDRSALTGGSWQCQALGGIGDDQAVPTLSRHSP